MEEALASPPDPAPSAAGRWLPGAIDLLVVAVAAAFAWRPVTFTHDSWWHLRLGRRILDEPWFPAHETFLWTAQGERIPHASWLSDLLFAALDRAGGLGLVEVLGLLLIALVLRATWALGRALGASPALAAAAIVALAWSAWPFFILRPHLFTFLGFALLFLAWVRGRERPLGRAWWTAPPLVGLWANLHGGFLLGLAFLVGVGLLEGAQALAGPQDERPLRARRARGLLLLAAAAALCACVHPQGPTPTLSGLAALGDPSLRHIDEWLPTPLQHAPLFAPLLLLGVVVALAQPRWPPLHELGAYLGTCWLALTTWRHLPLFGIAGYSVLAAWATRALDARRAALPLSARLRARLDGLLGAGERGPGGWLALALLALGLGLLRAARPSDPLAHDLLRATYPVRAAAWVRAHALEGRLFNPYPWGGYLGYALEGQHLVYIDSRLEPAGWERLAEYFEVYGVHPGWDQALDRLAVDWILLEAGARLVEPLRLHPRWRRVYDDEQALVFVRQGTNAHLPALGPPPPPPR